MITGLTTLTKVSEEFSLITYSIVLVLKRAYPDTQNGLSLMKLKVFMDKVHPREEYKEGNSTRIRKRPICKTKTGWHCWRPSFRKSDFDVYGMGVVIYFQFVKYMACMFFWMTVMSIPAMAFYWSGNPADSYTASTVIPALSLGNIGASGNACSSGTYDRRKNLVEITLKCPFGQLSSITNFGQIGGGTIVQCSAIRE